MHNRTGPRILSSGDPGLPPIELEHEACDDHATRDLEGHAPNDVHLVTGVRVEGRVIELLGIQQLLTRSSGGYRTQPGPRTRHRMTSWHPTRCISHCLPSPSPSVPTSSQGHHPQGAPKASFPSPSLLPALLHHHLGPIQLPLRNQGSAGVCNIEEVLHTPQESALVPTGGIDVKGFHLASTETNAHSRLKDRLKEGWTQQ